MYCPECDEEFTFDFDSVEFREYGSAECSNCGHDMENLEPGDYAIEPVEADILVPHVNLDRHQCSACDEIFGIRPEFSSEVNCPYCGKKYA